MSRDIRFRIAYRSPDLDEPTKWLLSLPLTPDEMMFGSDTQVDFTDGGYLRFDELQGEGAEIVFQQWTGVNDKDGKPIYEGDIISVTPEGVIGCITYRAEIPGYTLTNPNWPTLRWDLDLIDRNIAGSFSSGNIPARTGETDTSRLTVIGNIHQHFDLLPTIFSL